MDLKKQKVLFLSHASLSTGFVVGSHQLGKCFSSKNVVYHVSSPVTPFHIFRGKTGRSKLKNSLSPKQNENFGFTDFIPLVPFPYGISGVLDYLNNVFVFLYFKIFKIPTKFDITLIDQPSLVGFYEHFIDSAKMVYRPTDIYKDMGGEKYISHEKRCIEMSDGVIATSQEVMNALDLDSLKPKLVIENGVDFDFFNRDCDSGKRAGLVYVGAVDFRFDFEFVINLAKSLPSENIDIYGPVSVDIQACKPISNLRFLGKLNYENVPSTLSRYKFGLLPLNDHPANIGRSPMKLFEYQAAGLLCLVPRFAKYESLKCETFFVYRDVYDAVSLFEANYQRKAVSYLDLCLKCAEKEAWETKANDLLFFVNSLSVHNSERKV